MQHLVLSAISRRIGPAADSGSGAIMTSCMLPGAIRNTRGLPLSSVVNGPRNLPSFGRAKFPTLAGLVISRWRDRRLHSWVAGRGAWVATPAVEVGSEPLIGCAQARGRRAGEDGSSNPRSE